MSPISLRTRRGGVCVTEDNVNASSQAKITDVFKEAKIVGDIKRKYVKVKPDENNSENKKGEDGETYDAKRALQISAPVKLPCRDEQVEEVMVFIRDHLENGTPGSMYISGAPGTGKTAVVKHVITLLRDEFKNDMKKSCNFVDVFVNCMNLKEPAAIFDVVAQKLHLKTTCKGVELAERISNRAVSKTGRPAVIILDEMDQLLAGSKEILYRAFEWTRISGSKFILIGIANSLDITVRHIPLITASPKSMSPKARTPAGAKSEIVRQQQQQMNTPPAASKLIQFPPYERADIEKILESRMTEVGSHVFDTTAIKFVAAKVSATTGDMRKALNACQNALEATEKSQRPVLKATADDGFNSASPKKTCIRDERIGIAAMSKILVPKKDDGAIPLQQKIILATLLKINKEVRNSANIPQDGVTSAIPMAAIYETYRKICSDKGLSWIDRGELSSMLELLEDRSLVHVTEASKGTTAKKVKSAKGGKASVFFHPQAVKNLVKSDAVVDSIVG